MKRRSKAPFLSVVGAPAPEPAPPPPRRRKTGAELDLKMWEDCAFLEAMLPAYAEVHRAWAKASGAAHAYCDANYEPEQRGLGDSPGNVMLNHLYHKGGADITQKAMCAMYPQLSATARRIKRAPARSIIGMRAKALAAMFECIPSSPGSGFEFVEPETFEMLFRACIATSGLSDMAATLEKQLTFAEAKK